MDAFRSALLEHGLVEDQHYQIETRFAEGDLRKLKPLADELVRLQVDAIVALPTSGALAAKAATSSIPIIVPLSLDAVRTGLVESLARPGGNVTGLTLMSADLIGKRLELLREILPQARRLALLSIAGIPHITAPFIDEMKAVADQIGMELEVVEVDERYDFAGAFRAIADAQIDAVYVLESQAFDARRESIMAIARERRLPVISGAPAYARAGALLSYGPDGTSMFRRTAALVVKVLGGASPGELPMEQPTHFELALNVATARLLGIEVSPAILARADEVIE